jgi:hypothetical protein
MTLNLPTGNVEPELGEQAASISPSVSSIALTTNATAAPSRDSAKTSRVDPGRISRGGMISPIVGGDMDAIGSVVLATLVIAFTPCSVG